MTGRPGVNAAGTESKRFTRASDVDLLDRCEAMLRRTTSRLFDNDVDRFLTMGVDTIGEASGEKSFLYVVMALEASLSSSCLS